MSFNINVLIDHNAGFWEKNSSLNWCEEDYQVSDAVAEWYNTLTNTVFIMLAGLGLFLCQKHKLEWRFYIAFTLLLMVGIGSFLFHATLKYSTQLLDELPMLYNTAALLFTCIEIENKAQKYWFLPGLLLFISSGVSVLYLVLHTPLFHQIAFGVGVFTIILKGLCTILYNEKLKGLSQSQRSSIYRLFGLSISTFLLGFLLWNVDNTICLTLREVRINMGMLGALLQFHGWWHLLTGYGSYCAILGACYLRNALLTGNFALEYFLGFIPVITSKYKLHYTGPEELPI